MTNARRGKILLFGPALTAVSGVSTHLNQLFASPLSERYQLVHFQVGREGRQEATVGRIGRLLWSMGNLLAVLLQDRPDVV
ncbi:MAG: hypothetical protein AB1566_12485, partial [Chloroflexota bacterium]